MIDSLLFLPDVDLVSDVVDPPSTPDASAPAASEADEAIEAQVAAALAASRDAHAHAAAGAWVEASAAFARSAGIRDGLVAAGVAGPVVAARAWSDAAAVRVAAGDLDRARAALERVRRGMHAASDLPPDVRAAIAELETAIGPTAIGPTAIGPTAVAPTAEAEVEPIAGGLLWLDTTDETIEVLPAPVDTGAADDIGTPAAPPRTTPTDAPPARIAAIDVAVALASGTVEKRAPGGLAARVRRLLKR